MSKRLLRDIQAVKEDTEWGFGIEVDESDVRHLKASFPGPSGSPYEGGEFVVKFEFDREYPLKAPRVSFETKVFHPNISSQTGATCLDILKESWTPIYNIRSILISLQQLLESPNANDPQDAEVAGLFNYNKAEFERVASEWTRKYAKPEQPKADEKSIAEFQQMGFSREQILKVFEKLGIDKVSSDEEKNKVAEALLT